MTNVAQQHIRSLPIETEAEHGFVTERYMTLLRLCKEQKRGRHGHRHRPHQLDRGRQADLHPRPRRVQAAEVELAAAAAATAACQVLLVLVRLLRLLRLLGLLPLPVQLGLCRDEVRDEHVSGAAREAPRRVGAPLGRVGRQELLRSYGKIEKCITE